MGMVDFFAMEAGEYLERLDALVSPAEAPNVSEFLRLSRALRGSALMADQQTIGDVAAGVEGIARGVKETKIPWDEAVRQLTIRAIEDLKVLVRGVRSWGSAEDARAERLLGELRGVSGASAAAGERGASGELDAGTRAFIAREGAAVGSALDRAAKTLAQNPRALDSLDAVMRAMQPLRGIASLADLPPLPDLFDGVERAIGEVRRRPERVGGGARVFDAAARAVSRAAREVASEGRAEPDTEEAVEFVSMLGTLLGADERVVPIDRLYHSDQGPHIIEEGTAPAPSTQLDELELISYAEHLKHAAASLEEAGSQTQRSLRAHTLAGTLRPLADATGGGLVEAAAELARVVREAVARGVSSAEPEMFSRLLRDSGTLLGDAAQGNQDALGERLTRIVAALRHGVPSADEAPAPAPAAAPPSPPPPAPSPPPARPAAQAGPAQPRPVAASRPAAANDAGPDLAASFATYHKLMASARRRTPAASRTGAPQPRPQPRTEEQQPAATPTPTPSATPEPQREEAASITAYCYSGTAALERAISLGDLLRNALTHPAEASPQVNELVDELFDLIQLGLKESR